MVCAGFPHTVTASSVVCKWQPQRFCRAHRELKLKVLLEDWKQTEYGIRTLATWHLCYMFKCPNINKFVMMLNMGMAPTLCKWYPFSELHSWVALEVSDSCVNTQKPTFCLYCGGGGTILTLNQHPVLEYRRSRMPGNFSRQPDFQGNCQGAEIIYVKALCKL